MSNNNNKKLMSNNNKNLSTIIEEDTLQYTKDIRELKQNITVQVQNLKTNKEYTEYIKSILSNNTSTEQKIKEIFEWIQKPFNEYRLYEKLFKEEREKNKILEDKMHEINFDETLIKINKNLHKENIEKEQQIQYLKYRLNKQANMYNGLQNALYNQKQELQEKDKLLQAFDRQNEVQLQSQEDIEKYGRMQKEVIAEVKLLRQDKETLINQNKQQQKLLETYKQQQLEEKEKMKKEMEKMKKEMEKMKKEMEKGKLENQTLQEENQILQKKNKDDNTIHYTYMEQKDKDIEQLKEDFAKEREELIEEYKNKLAEQNKGLDKYWDQKRKEINDLREENIELSKKNLSLEKIAKDNQTLKSENEKLKSENEKLKNENENLKSENKTLNSTINKYRNAISKLLNKQYNSSTNYNDFLNSFIQTWEDRENKIKEMTAKLNSIKDIEIKKEQLTEENKALKDKIHEYNVKNNDNSSELYKKEMEIKRLKSMLSDAKQQSDNLAKVCEEQQEELKKSEKIPSVIKNQNIQIADLGERLKAKDIKIADLEERLKKMRLFINYQQQPRIGYNNNHNSQINNQNNLLYNNYNNPIRYNYNYNNNYNNLYNNLNNNRQFRYNNNYLAPAPASNNIGQGQSILAKINRIESLLDKNRMSINNNRIPYSSSQYDRYYNNH